MATAVKMVGAQEKKILVGISSCLLGESVRYNGGHKHSRYCTEQLAEHFEFRAFCPEVAIGLGIPREPIRLQGEFDQPRVVGTVHQDKDVTDDLLEYADAVAADAQALCGYIFMKDSPSCGLYSTKVYGDKGTYPKKRAGIFAERLLQHLPLLPVEEAGRLNDPVLRENFIARVFFYADWRRSMEINPTAAKLVAFHSRHKYFAMSYSQKLYRTLGRLVADAGHGGIELNARQYIECFLTSTQKAPSRKGHVNVLYHLVGYLKKTVPGGIRQDLTAAIEDYRQNVVPLAVPMKLMTHYIDNYASEYIQQQSYLSPYPYGLGLRNSI